MRAGIRRAATSPPGRAGSNARRGPTGRQLAGGQDPGEDGHGVQTRGRPGGPRVSGCRGVGVAGHRQRRRRVKRHGMQGQRCHQPPQARLAAGAAQPTAPVAAQTQQPTAVWPRRHAGLPRAPMVRRAWRRRRWGWIAVAGLAGAAAPGQGKLGRTGRWSGLCRPPKTALFERYAQAARLAAAVRANRPAASSSTPALTMNVH